MRIRRPSGLTILTSALLILLPAVAVMQYRWVGQVSDAERTRMQRNLVTAASQFRETFEGEIARAVNGLRTNATTVREAAWSRYADRYATWADTAEHPQIVDAIFLIDLHDGELRLRRWNTQTHTFDAAAWAPPLSASYMRFMHALHAFSTGQPLGSHALIEDDSLLVAPVIGAQPRRGAELSRPPVDVIGFTVVQLDMAYIRDGFLPALVRRHFDGADGDRYRVAITAAANASRVIYRSDPDAPTDAALADEVEPLYGAFRDPLVLLQRSGGGRGGRTWNVIVRRGGEGEWDGRQRGPRNAGRWVLLVQHESGSLGAAVARVRYRNLGISFGVLILLSGSIALLALSSRRAQRLARQQMEFVAGVSHELRTPVAVIRSAAENLSHGVVDSAERVKRYGEVIEAEARRLGEMVEHVLQYAGIASRTRADLRTPLAPAAIIESAMDAAAPALGPVHVQRSIAPDLPPVLGDAAALRSAVQNLIVNAVKYGGPEGWVGVRAEASRHGRDAEVRITVEDHGPGIPSDELPHIFEPFYRGGRAVSGQVHGNGLGLAVVRQIVAAHGGRVTVSTRAGVGSSFTIALPAAEGEPRGVAADTRSPQAASGAVH